MKLITGKNTAQLLILSLVEKNNCAINELVTIKSIDTSYMFYLIMFGLYFKSF